MSTKFIIPQTQNRNNNTKTDSLINIKTNKKETKKNIFDYVFKFYNNINDNIEITESFFDDIKISEISSLMFFINRYLIYMNGFNYFSELIFKVSMFLSNKEYIIWLSKFLIKNNIKFPKYMKMLVFFRKKPNINIIKEYITQDKNILDDENFELLLLNTLKNKKYSIDDISKDILIVNG